MSIILEGPDGSGKSTLAKYLIEHLPFFLLYTPSLGPERYDGEIIERVKSYDRMNFRLFDRHPMISHPIYSAVSDKVSTEIPAMWIRRFYREKPLIVYCYGQGTHDLTESKPYDTPEHVEMVESKHQTIRQLYRQWAEVNVPKDLWYDFTTRSPETLTNLLKELYIHGK